jgi:hypothetical protein
MSLHLPSRSIRSTLPATSSSGRTRCLRRPGKRATRLVLVFAPLCVITLLLASCRSQSDSPDVIKIGVLAPFEGVGRRLGYAILPAMKSELASANRKHSLGPYRVSLVALNDDLSPLEAAAQARALVQDPDVRAVIGLWSDDTAQSAAPILAEAGVPVLLAAPYQGFASELISMCPTPGEVAAELLRVAEASADGSVAVAGPDTTLRRALSAQDPALSVIPETSVLPCEGMETSDCGVIYSGDAVGAAEALRLWRASGWRGAFLGGPETAKPWLAERAGGSAEGARALVCGSPGSSSPDQDASLQAAADLAGAAVRTISDGLERVVAKRGKPSRQAIAEWLSSDASTREVAWLVVRDGRWVRLHE